MSQSRELTPVAQVCTTISSPEFKSKIKDALPPGIDPDRFVRVTMTALQQNPTIANGDRQSLYNAVIRCAQDGLSPDGKQAALVMFGQAVQYMPMIGGLRKIAADHGIIMATGVVHKNDHFEYELGVKPYKVHKPAPLDQERGEPIGAWAEALDDDGRLYLEVMGKGDIEQVRTASRAKNGDLWSKWWGEAARKTVGRRLFKSLPLADKLDEREVRILAAADADMEFDRGTGEVRPETAQDVQQGGRRRPRALDAVAAQAPASGPQEAIDGEFTAVDDPAAGDGSGDPAAGGDHF